MWNTVLLCKSFTYLCFSIPQLFPTHVSLLRPCCGSSCSVHPTVVYFHTPKKSISQYQPFSSNINKWKQDIYVLNTKPHDTLAHTAGKKQNDLVSTVSRRNTSVHVSAARSHWDRLHLLKRICLFCRCRSCMSVSNIGQIRMQCDHSLQIRYTRHSTQNKLLIKTNPPKSIKYKT